MRLVILLVALLSVPSAWVQTTLAQSPPPVLRGIVITQSGGDARAYFEDPTTGVLGAHAVGDVIDGNRIEQIREDLVVLRRGDEVIRIQMGSGPESETSASGVAAARPAVGEPAPRPAPGVMPVYRPNPKGGPTIGNGQPWLDRLGIPAEALSRAIEEAQQPSPEPDSDNLKN